jgi:solute carrier family 12 (sodium/potassium/chloride transporter), member 2
MHQHRNMSTLLKKFRIKFHSIVMIMDVTKTAGKKIQLEFDEMIRQGSGEVPMVEDDILAKTNFHLRIAEIVRENSSNAAIIVMTLPMPKKDHSLPAGIYMAWLDIITKTMPPFLLIRGNQDSVLTFYS